MVIVHSHVGLLYSNFTKWGTTFHPKLGSSSQGLKARPGHRFVAADDRSACPTGPVLPGELGQVVEVSEKGWMGKSVEMILDKIWENPWIDGK